MGIEKGRSNQYETSKFFLVEHSYSTMPYIVLIEFYPLLVEINICPIILALCGIRSNRCNVQQIIMFKRGASDISWTFNSYVVNEHTTPYM